ncbi:BrnT family toxin [Beijerinckia sp. L45]|uniref:BrnT family toxin n=1 Tax=Beijerinckia sp. L45 TaxID=1641855 RepID=UPI001FEE3CDE|nr:BrnT family toxin [Beijerinckia sp. L45]
MIDKQRPTSFDWHDKNEADHVARHGISFAIASAVFLDPRRIETEDRRKDYGERRWNTVGLVDGVCINVTFAMVAETARIISARPAHRKERRRYGS